MVDPKEEIKMTYSAVVAKDGKPVVAIKFERGKDFAEALLPDHTIQSSFGFSEEEVAALEFYLKRNKKEIGAKAKEITGITHLLGD